jgi:hypothetical protein
MNTTAVTTVQQAPGLYRTDLQHSDLSVLDRVVIQNRVDFFPDAPAVCHWHPGEEIILHPRRDARVRHRRPGAADRQRRPGPDRPR